jgi:hypothetical protein
MNTLSAWKLSATDASIRTVSVPCNPLADLSLALKRMVETHLGARDYKRDLHIYSLQMRDESSFMIVYEDQSCRELPENKAARLLFNRFRVSWHVRANPLGSFLILKLSADNNLISFPQLASTLEWVRHVNSNMNYTIQSYMSPYGKALRFKEPPAVSAFLQKRVESLSTDMAVIAPLVLATLGEDEECPVGMEPLNNYGTIYVPECGHVCGPDAVDLKTCPVCRCKCTWTAVNNLPSIASIKNY